jgi:hypothetical protein
LTGDATVASRFLGIRGVTQQGASRWLADRRRPKVVVRAGLYALLVAAAHGPTDVVAAPITARFDFSAWAADNGSQGFPDDERFTLDRDGLTLVASAYEAPNGRPSNVYLDGLRNDRFGGLGACRTLVAGNECYTERPVPASTNTGRWRQEVLALEFGAGLSAVTLELLNPRHNPFALIPPRAPNAPERGGVLEYRPAGGEWTPLVTDALGFASIVLDGVTRVLEFRAAVPGAVNAFEIAAVTVTTPIPLPPALLLLAAGLAGLGRYVRR